MIVDERRQEGRPTTEQLIFPHPLLARRYQSQYVRAFIPHADVMVRLLPVQLLYCTPPGLASPSIISFCPGRTHIGASFETKGLWRKNKGIGSKGNNGWKDYIIEIL
jgi:hypothetical protein